MTSGDLTSISACSLEADGAARRAADFRAILAPALRGLRRVGAMAELDLALGAAGERRLAELLELERQCCPFWRFSLTRRSPRLVRLLVRAEAPHEAALDAFLTLTRARRDAPDRNVSHSQPLRRTATMAQTPAMTHHEHHTHAEHAHAHGPDCGHTAVVHGDHVDYLHDGHLHHPHDDHVDEHAIAADDANPASCTDGHDCAGHVPAHVHGPDCGHEAIPHDAHTDYLVAGHLHHPHSEHCDHHGAVLLAG